MSLIGLAGRCDVTSTSLKSLMAGKVPVAVASKLGVTSSSLQKFIDGGTSISLAGKLGILSTNLQEVRNTIGKEGAIGMILGLLANHKSM